MAETRSVSGRDVVELRARVAQQSETIEQLRDEIGWLTQELIAREGNGDVRADDGAPPEWKPMLQAIRRLVHESVPRGSRLAVVSSGVEALLRHAGYRAEHLSQDRFGGYSGSHPSCGRVAIVQVESARWRGADALLIPHSELWWFEHYPELEQHLDRRYARVADGAEAGVIWSLRTPSRLREVHDLLAGLSGGLDHRPALLDWHTGRDLARSFDEYKVFSPLGDGPTLSYLDDTIDVVAIGSTTAARVAEARRVASSFVVRAGDTVDVVWRAGTAEVELRDVSVTVASRDGAPSAPAYVDRLLETLPAGFAGEIVLDRACEPGASRKGVELVDCPDGEPFDERLRRCAAAASRDVLVALDAETWPVPGWLRPLVTLLHDADGAACVTGLLVEPDGCLIGADPGGRLDSPRHSYVRTVDPTPCRYFAMQRDRFLEGAPVETLLYQPDALAISSWSGAEAQDD